MCRTTSIGNGIRRSKAEARVRPLAGLGPVVAALMLAAALPAGVSAQGDARATAGASITIPRFSHLDVAPVASSSHGADDGAEPTVRLRVRSNHAWSVLVAAGTGAGGGPGKVAGPGAVRGPSIECRADGPHGRAVAVPTSGGSAVVATGGKGKADVVVSCRIPAAVDAAELIWTLTGA
jgi:hypothetical protein